MSLGGSPGRSSFGRKGSSTPQKKIKRKKQEFHKRKIRFLDEGKEVTLAQLKKRVMLSLDRLGHQKFSVEPGGYSLDSWIASFNLLLDDFENKISKEKLPTEYFERRVKSTEELIKPVDVSDLEAEIEKLRPEEREASLRVLDSGFQTKPKRDKETKIETQNMVSLKRDRDRYSKELAEKKLLLDEKKNKVKSGSFLKRVFGGTVSSEINSLEKRIKTLEERISELDEKISVFQEKRKATLKETAAENALSEGEEKLATIRSKISEIESQKLERMQLVERREAAATSMSEVISNIELPPEEAPQEILLEAPPESTDESKPPGPP